MFTTDTRKAHCPIRIVYGPQTFTEDGAAFLDSPINASSLSDKADRPGSGWNCSWPLAIIKYTEHSDYSGSDVEASSYRVLCEAKDIDHLVEIYGSHGYKALAYDATLGPVPSCEALSEMLEQLEGYPLLDEDDHSELKSDLEMEAWDDHGQGDFRRALEPLLDAIDPGHDHVLPDNDAAAPTDIADAVTDYMRTCGEAHTWKTLLFDVWRLGCDQLNVNGGAGFAVETGCTVHFYIGDWIAKAGADKRYPTDRPIHDLLRELAVACREAK